VNPTPKAEVEEVEVNEVVETEEETPVEEYVKEEPKKASSKIQKKYWRTYVYIPGIGTVCGEATKEQMDAFIVASKGAAKVEKFLSDTDVLAELEAEKRSRSRKKLGLE